ncbi:MAG: GntR family transcriptional regulator [marine bacterium B5-7]|nr:MAG: GntR family transcriptional regulator [marine bacterium B5-7]
MSQQSQFLYDRVYDLIVDQIRAGSLRPGDKLPSLRRMSLQLNVSIATVMQGYVNLEREGFIRSRPQSGFFVNSNHRAAPQLPSATSPKPIVRDIKMTSIVLEMLRLSRQPNSAPMGTANPASSLLPVRALGRTAHRVVTRNPAAAIDYTEPAGHHELRRQIAYRMSANATVVDPEQIIITNGASEAMALTLKSVTSPGDTVAVESPTYFLLLQLIEDLGLKAIEVPSDPTNGLNLDAFEEIVSDFPISAMLCVVNFNNPYGSLMPDASKERLVAIANRAGVRLVEDDIYGDLHFGPYRPRPLQSFDRQGNVVLCSSFSKTLAPGYRIGWIVADRDREEMLSRKHTLSIANSSITQMTIAEFLASGGYDRHLKQFRRALKQQVDRMRYELAAVLPATTRISQPQGGFVLWVELPRGIDVTKLFHRGLEEGVNVMPGTIFSPTRKFRNCIRVNCGHPFDSVIEGGIARLGQLVDEQN